MLNLPIEDILLIALRKSVWKLDGWYILSPCRENVCAVTPVYKKGDAYDTGINCSSVQGQYLNLCLVFYLAEDRLRVDGQIGFRPDLSTTYQKYIMQHLEVNSSIG